ncbi:MAG: hypothetical protein HY290_02695 [Planctomycetia bacterium]|nr:hypothetical protein [Planctomycetia bacterium]
MHRISSAARCCVLLILAVACCCPSRGSFAQNRGRQNKRPRDVATFRKKYAELRDKYAASLIELARTCEDDKGLPEAAALIRALAEPIDTTELRLAPLPRHVVAPLPADVSADERFWRSQLKVRQQDHAKELYALSRQALFDDHVSFSLDLVREILLHDSDNVAARRILGFVRSGDEWVSAFEARMRKEKKVWTDNFAWLPEDQVERYQQGKRYTNRRWISAEKDADLHRDFANAWEIKTEHYRVRTNHSLEKGADLARKLEDFHELFFQMMGGFFNNSSEVQALFAGNAAKPGTRQPKQHVVHFYRTRDEYIATLKQLTKQPIEITKGIYFPDSGIAHFFFDPESDDDSTLYHEATHQLLSGSRPMTGEIGMKSDFWIIEGIACYMESFKRDGERFTVGDPQHGRLQAARMHFLNEGYYVPLREFTRMGMVAFQSIKKPEIAMNYSQGAALAHFFMHYDDGRYREALIEHLSQMYSPNKATRENPDSLEDLTGVAAEELDRQYADYIRRLGPPTQRTRAPVGANAGP